MDGNGSYLGMSKGCFVLKDRNGNEEKYPLFENEIKEVVLRSGNSVSTGALSSLGFWGVDVMVMTQRGRPVAMMKSLDDDSHVKTRLCQYEAYLGEKRSYIAKQIILGKMKGQNILLEKYGLQPHDEDAITSKIDGLESTNSVSYGQKLNGIEGARARARRKAGLKAGLPRFKKYGTYKSITYPQSGFKLEGPRLLLSKIGAIRIRQHRIINGQIKTLTVKRTASGKWFACFSCVINEQPKEKPFKDVGIDVGLNSYAVFSDGNRIENPRFYRKSEKRLAQLQKSLSRKKKGSRNWAKGKFSLARLHEKIGNRRTDFLHKDSRKIADTYETIYFEDLNIRNMVRNHCLSKSISDAGWGRFIGMIAYKAESAGGRLIPVDPRGTTQMCSRCGEKVEKSLSDRIHECPYCGLVMNRDENAALNILARGREIRREPPEYRPAEEKATTPPRAVVQAYPVKQEASLLVGR